jgi:hypothetical protein
VGLLDAAMAVTPSSHSNAASGTIIDTALRPCSVAIAARKPSAARHVSTMSTSTHTGSAERPEAQSRSRQADVPERRAVPAAERLLEDFWEARASRRELAVEAAAAPFLLPRRPRC